VLGYTGSGKRPYAQLMIGNSYAALGDKAAAKDAYSKARQQLPRERACGEGEGKALPAAVIFST